MSSTIENSAVHFHEAPLALEYILTDRGQVTQDVISPSEHDTPAPNTLERPSQGYQMLLLLSGFLMIFHVIGIGQVYGIFQVNICLILTSKMSTRMR